LFVMSFCPYWIQAEESLWEVKSTLGDEVIFDPHFVVGLTDGEYNSLHGQYELIEDVRQLCILYEYTENHWWTYINCLYDRYESDSWTDDSESPWRDCAEEASISVTTIENCIKQMNSTLLCYDYGLAQEFNVYASPTVLIEGNLYTGERTPEAYFQAILETSLKMRVTILEIFIDAIIEQLIIVKQAICSVHPSEGFEFCQATTTTIPITTTTTTIPQCPCDFIEESHEVCCPSDCSYGYYCRADIYRFGRFSRSENLNQGQCKSVNPSQYSIKLYGICE